MLIYPVMFLNICYWFDFLFFFVSLISIVCVLCFGCRSQEIRCITFSGSQRWSVTEMNGRSTHTRLDPQRFVQSPHALAWNFIDLYFYMESLVLWRSYLLPLMTSFHVKLKLKKRKTKKKGRNHSPKQQSMAHLHS